MSPVNRTQAFLSDESFWPDVKIQLSDVQGLWGGRSIFISGAGHAVVQVVSPAMVERRYKLELGGADVQRLLRVCIENDLVAIRCAERMGLPDEARPAITLINEANDRHTISKWANVKNARFEAIYAELMRVETMTAGLEPVYSGPFAPEYVPEGF